MGRITTEVKEAAGMEKITILATHADLLRERIEALGSRRSIDEQIEILEINRLAEEYGSTPETLKKQIAGTLGASAVFKVGKKTVIRKSRFLEFLELKEGSALNDPSSTDKTTH